MASKKTKKKSDKKVNVDERFNLFVRINALRMICDHISIHKNNYSQEATSTLINHIKEAYPAIIDMSFEYNIDKSYFILTLEFVRDLLFLAYNGVPNIKDSIIKMKDILVSRLKENNIKHELLISTSQLGAIFENIYVDKHATSFSNAGYGKPDYANEIATSVTNIQYSLVLYLMTYIDKYKNKEYDRYELRDDGHTYLIYKNKPMLSLEDINHSISCCLSFRHDNMKYINCVMKYSKLQHEIYSKFVTQAMDEEYVDTSSDTYYLKNAYTNLPLLGDMMLPIISIKELNKIPHDRLFAAPKAGIRFEFVNKNTQIDYIDMKETKTHIFFNVYIISDGEVYCGDFPYDAIMFENKAALNKINAKLIEKGDTFKLSFFFDKRDLSECDGYYEKYESFGSASNYVSNKHSELLKKGLYGVLMTCIYMAYYDHDLFKGEVRMYNRKFDKMKGYTREDFYRVAHLRKLPTGQKCGDDALEKARKEGFDYIPEGYTFVKAASSSDKADKKVIKVRE